MDCDISELPITDVIARCENAEQEVEAFKMSVGHWSTPLSLPEKVEDLTQRFNTLKTCWVECKEYSERLTKLIETSKNARITKKRNWRNLKGSLSTTLEKRQMPGAIAKVVGFAQQHSKDPCVESYIESIFSSAEINDMPAKMEDQPTPFDKPAKLSGALHEEVAKVMSADKAVLDEKFQELVGKCVTDNHSHVSSTCTATKKVDYQWGREVEDSYMEVLNDKSYCKHIVTCLENGRFDIAPSVAMFTGVPQVLTVGKGTFVACILSAAEANELGTDFVSQTAKISANALEGGQIGKNFFLTTGESLWIPYGACAMLVALCSKSELNKWRKKVLAWPSMGAQAAKRTIDDFSYVVIDPVLDKTAIGAVTSCKTRLHSQMVMQEKHLPQSLKLTTGFKEWQKALGN